MFVRHYPRLPMRGRLLGAWTRAEGGQFVSRTLRLVLEQHHGVSVGKHSYGSLLRPGMADRGTSIARYVSVGPNVRRFGAAHPVDRLTLHPYWYNPRFGLVDLEQDVQRTECLIDHDAWIGANVVILPGCRRIGIGAVVGAGSIVTRDVPDFHVVAGVPARTTSIRLSPTHRHDLLEACPWELEPQEANEVLERLKRKHGS